MKLGAKKTGLCWLDPSAQDVAASGAANFARTAGGAVAPYAGSLRRRELSARRRRALPQPPEPTLTPLLPPRNEERTSMDAPTSVSDVAERSDGGTRRGCVNHTAARASAKRGARPWQPPATSQADSERCPIAPSQRLAAADRDKCAQSRRTGAQIGAVAAAEPGAVVATRSCYFGAVSSAYKRGEGTDNEVLGNHPFHRVSLPA